MIWGEGADDLRSALGFKIGPRIGVFSFERKRGKAIPEAEVRMGMYEREDKDGDFLGEC